MTESPLYYAFSTVPQPLGGGGAILVAVVLYRLGEIDRIIDAAADHLETAWQAYPFRELWRALERNGWKGVERVLRRLDAVAAGGGAAEQAACRRADRGVQAARRLLVPRHSAVGLTGPALPVRGSPSPGAPHRLA